MTDRTPSYMKDYPIDRWASVLTQPIERARRTKFRLLKVVWVVTFVVLNTCLLPVTGVLLFVSLAMAFWDDVNS